MTININSKFFILIVLIIASVLIILNMVAGVPYKTCLIIAMLTGILLAFLMKFGIIKIEGIDIKK